MKHDDPFGWDGMAREHILNVEPSGDEWSLVVIETGERKPLLAKPDSRRQLGATTPEDMWRLAGWQTAAGSGDHGHPVQIVRTVFPDDRPCPEYLDYFRRGIASYRSGCEQLPPNH